MDLIGKTSKQGEESHFCDSLIFTTNPTIQYIINKFNILTLHMTIHDANCHIFVTICRVC